jgi:RNA polymerase sigma-70 factor (ECF subfamily)
MLKRSESEAMERTEFEGAVRQHKDRVHSHAAWMLHGFDDARDVAQEALLKLWVHRDKVQTRTAGSWLLRTTHNLCIDRLRRRRVRPQVDPEQLDTMIDCDNPDPSRSAEATELGRMIATALRSLSPRDRSAVLMREVYGMTYEEIAIAIDAPLGTIKSIIHRSRDRLRRELTVAGATP